MRASRCLIALALATLACSDSGGDEPAASSATTTDPSVTTPTFDGDGSAFCDAMLGIGEIERDVNDTPEDLLAENERLVALLDEAEANTPSDAPADLAALLDDFRKAAVAITAAGGDVDAAFETLRQDDPDLLQRLGSSTSHPAGYDFLVDRCGITVPEEG